MAISPEPMNSCLSAFDRAKPILLRNADIASSRNGIFMGIRYLSADWLAGPALNCADWENLLQTSREELRVATRHIRARLQASGRKMHGAAAEAHTASVTVCDSGSAPGQ